MPAMFSGLVEGRAEVVALARSRGGAHLELGRPELGEGASRWRPVRGESIAVNGCCLTVARSGRGGRTAYDLSRETLARTALGALAVGSAVNVERALRLGDRLGGHLVSGHVDAVGRVVRLVDAGEGGRLATFEVPRGFERWLLAKGSITLDGVSLTIVAPRGRRFQVALIPETLRRTTLGAVRPGARVNLEADLIGKWIAQCAAESLAARGARGARARRPLRTLRRARS
jgi:riboflavin synthase